MAELKPCQCGNKDVVIKEKYHANAYYYEWAVVCPKCGATGPYAEQEFRAIDAWNRRVK